jgi:hypothetical protein
VDETGEEDVDSALIMSKDGDSRDLIRLKGMVMDLGWEEAGRQHGGHVFILGGSGRNSL